MKREGERCEPRNIKLKGEGEGSKVELPKGLFTGTGGRGPVLSYATRLGVYRLKGGRGPHDRPRTDTSPAFSRCRVGGQKRIFRPMFGGGEGGYEGQMKFSLSYNRAGMQYGDGGFNLFTGIRARRTNTK